MKTAWLRKYPRVSGAERFNAYYVMVEIIREEAKVTQDSVYEFVDDPERTAITGIPGCQKRIQVGVKEISEAGYLVREKGRKVKWVPAHHVFHKDPHGGDPCAIKRS